MCAIGCLIPDDEYTKTLENQHAGDRLVAGLPCFSPVVDASGVHAEAFLRDLQIQPDKETNWDKNGLTDTGWANMRAFARQYKVFPAIIDTLLQSKTALKPAKAK